MSTGVGRELKAALAGSAGLFVAVGLFSVFANLLMLTGPLFMLQVYDRVLSSRAEETLIALFVLVVALYALMGVLDYARGHVLSRIGIRLQERLDGRVFESVLRRAVDPVTRSRPATALADLEAVRRLFGSPALMAFFDLPWTPIFIAAIFIFHPSMGWLAVAGGILILIGAVVNQVVTRRANAAQAASAAAAETLAEALRRDAEAVQGLGMRDAGLARWRALRDGALDQALVATDRGGTISAFTKSFRFLLQSAMLALGAWLVLQQQLTPGAMIAASILLGRALAPVEQLVGQWPMVQRARGGWASLGELLETTPPVAGRTALPTPAARLDVAGLVVVPPGARVPVLRGATFRVEPGQAMGVIGPSASGKSSLARVLAGVWYPAAGSVRLDGAALDQYDDATRGRHVGYLPQDVALFDGTVAENIARMALEPDAEAVVAAARRAGAHEMILRLPEGYDTRISEQGSSLSGGQRQRIGLARAMYGDPAILVLDEPNANLDAEGTDALNAAIAATKAEGRSVIIMAHRPAAIAAVDTLMIVENGLVTALGPRDDVLRQKVRNHAALTPSSSPRTAQAREGSE
ncbi:MAG: type I secretion system permease/ATPase [Rubricella sp.]